jgi:hypothetical protein
MARWLQPRRLLDAAAVVGVVALAATVVVTLVLTWTYRPAPPAPWSDTALDPSGGTDVWLGLHASVAAVAGMGAFAFFLLLVWPTGRRVPWRRPLPVAAAALATLACAVAILTRDLVGWDQLALWSVNTGEDISGYWVAAVDDRVRFVLVDGQEIGQSTYARSLVAHLVSPLVAAASLAVAWRAVSQQHESSRSTGA